ncbi:hemagglutinin repeat-containing protein, partial [Burkholderia gladioli]
VSTMGGSASFSSSKGNASGNYAGVNEQAGIQAGDGGFNVNVTGNTALTGAMISSTADPSKNTLTTSTLTTSDIANHSAYNADSSGLSAGAGVGVTGKAVGPGSVSGSGGVTPMISQSDSGNESATTRSGVSAGTINITNPAGQTQDLANLNRDTSNLNGTVSKTPDVQNLLDKQADLMNAGQAAGQVVAQGIGAYSDMKQKEAQSEADAAKLAGDTKAQAAYQAEADSWAEGGSNRVQLHVLGGALIGGLGGGSALTAIGGAAGAGLTAIMANALDDISKGVTSGTGSELLGNFTANVIAGLGSVLVGGNPGAATGSNVQLYNQMLDRKGKSLLSKVCAATNPACSDQTITAISNAEAANSAQAAQYVQTGAMYGLPAAVVSTLGSEAIAAAALAGGFDYIGSYYNYKAGFSADAPSLTNSYIAGIVGGLSTPFTIGEAAIAGMSKVGRVAAGAYNAGVAGVGAFGTAGMTGSNPDLSAGIATSTNAAGAWAKAVLPAPIGNLVNQIVQGAAGPIQGAIESWKKNGK